MPCTAALDLMELDCEGAEWAIFRNEESFVTVREIRMEYHLTEGHSLNDLRAAAKRLGFEITHLRQNQSFGTAFLTNHRTNEQMAMTSRELP